MSFTVLLTDEAIRDLEDIDDYILKHDSPENADYVLSRIEENLLNLTDLPDRGAYPKELSTLGIREYREVFFKPYRELDKNIYVYVITDGRRDMQTLLNRRLLSA